MCARARARALLTPAAGRVRDSLGFQVLDFCSSAVPAVALCRCARLTLTDVQLLAEPIEGNIDEYPLA